MVRGRFLSRSGEHGFFVSYVGRRAGMDIVQTVAGSAFGNRE